ncbi:hypothetical protein EDD15DRAFT_2176292, partial [Pisolithus albus]
EDEPPQKRPRKSRERSTRNLDSDLKHVVDLACVHFKCIVATSNPFPEISGDIDSMVVQAVENACRQSQIEVDLGRNERDLIKDRIFQLRGQLKEIARRHLANAYGFKSLADCLGYTTNELEQVKQANRELVGQLLKKSAFAYLDPSNRTQPGTMYKHPLIAKLIILRWFTDSRAEGVRYRKYFDPLPLPLLAFVLTAIQCAIDEWATGEHSGVKFQGAKYADVYQHHLKNLDGWKKFNETTNDNALERLRRDLLETARYVFGI